MHRKPTDLNLLYIKMINHIVFIQQKELSTFGRYLCIWKKRNVSERCCGPKVDVVPSSKGLRASLHH